MTVYVLARRFVTDCDFILGVYDNLTALKSDAEAIANESLTWNTLASSEYAVTSNGVIFTAYLYTLA